MTAPEKVEPKPLRCPYCGSEIGAAVSYAGEMDESLTIDCSGCRAEWLSDGQPYLLPDGSFAR